MNKKVDDHWLPCVFADEMEKALKGKSTAFALEVLNYWYRYTKQGLAYLRERRKRPAAAFVIEFLHAVKPHLNSEEIEGVELRVLNRLLTLCAAATQQKAR